MCTSGAENKLPRQLAAGGYQRGDQAAFAGARQRQGVLAMLIRHQGGNRAEGFDGMHRRGFIRLRAEQQRRREEGAGGVKIGLTAEQNLAPGLNQRVDIVLYILALLLADQRAHFYPFLRRVTDGDFLQTGNQRFADRINLGLRNEDAANCGTFLPGFGGHLAHHFADKQGKFRLLGGDILCEHAAVQRIGLHGEGDRFRHQVRVYAQLLAGMGGAGKGHHILAIQVIEQIARAAANQADGPVRYQPAVDDRFDHGLGQLGGGGGWLDDGRHPGKPGWRQLFQHAPAGEVKGVDMHRDAGF